MKSAAKKVATKTPTNAVVIPAIQPAIGGALKPSVPIKVLELCSIALAKGDAVIVKAIDKSGAHVEVVGKIGLYKVPESYFKFFGKPVIGGMLKSTMAIEIRKIESINLSAGEATTVKEIKGYGVHITVPGRPGLYLIPNHHLKFFGATVPVIVGATKGSIGNRLMGLIKGKGK